MADIETQNREIKLFRDPEELFKSAANDFSLRANMAIKNNGLFSVVLSGGNTPKLFFDALTDKEFSKKIPWEKIQFFFGDERYVPSNSTESNYHMAYEHLFSKVSVNPENIFKIPTKLDDPKEAATEYEQTLKKVFNCVNTFPIFDLIYLGLGSDGHTASLMPLSEPVINSIQDSMSNKNNPWVVALFIPTLNMYRITLTPSAINHAKNIIFLVTGIDKAKAVQKIISGPFDPKLYPAQLIHCLNGKTIWYLDEAASA